MAMVDPPHPGGIVRRECLEPLGLSVSRAAEGLGVSRQALSELVNEKAGVSVEMAIRLSKAFGSSPETWLGLQTTYDLWEARERASQLQVTQFTPVLADSDLFLRCTRNPPPGHSTDKLASPVHSEPTQAT